MQSTAPTKIEQLAIAKLRLDGQTQPRTELDQELVRDYADDYRNKADMPPVVVFHDGSDYWLADGFHRRHGADAAGFVTVACEVHNGTVDDARWYSYAANQTHGKRRTNDDKAKAVKAALQHPRGTSLSDSQIAEHVGTSANTVLKYRKELEAASQIAKVTTRTGKDGKTYDTSKIGKSKPAPDSADAEPTCPKCGSTCFDDGTCRACLPDDPDDQTTPDLGDELSGPDYGRCPNCLGTKWRAVPDGLDCATCGHPYGEPAGDVDDDRLTTQRQKTVKTCEALMRAFDDLQAMLARKEHTEAITGCKRLLSIAKGWR